MSTQVDETWSSERTASYIGIKRGTLECWRVKGKGPKFLKLGPQKQNGVLYRRSDVEAWLNEHTYTSTSAYSAAA